MSPPATWPDLLGVTATDALAVVAHPDGGMAQVPVGVLGGEVEETLGDADLLVVFEPGGVTGHPDRRDATAAATRVASRWGVSILE
jgi:mycothiol S-conjugate amidase